MTREAERRTPGDRRQEGRRAVDQTIPPERIWCCAAVREPLEHHLGNAGVGIGHFLASLAAADVNRLSIREQAALTAALSASRRLERLRLAVHPCELAALCPVAGRPIAPWRRRLVHWILGS